MTDFRIPGEAGMLMPSDALIAHFLVLLLGALTFAALGVLVAGVAIRTILSLLPDHVTESTAVRLVVVGTLIGLGFAWHMC